MGDRRNRSEPLYSPGPNIKLSSARAEIAALLVALQYIKTSSTSSGTSVSWMIYTDCNVLHRFWYKKSKLTVHLDLVRQVEKIQRSHGSLIRVEWVRAHKNDMGNINADALANAGRKRSIRTAA